MTTMRDMDRWYWIADPGRCNTCGASVGDGKGCDAPNGGRWCGLQCVEDAEAEVRATFPIAQYTQDGEGK